MTARAWLILLAACLGLFISGCFSYQTLAPRLARKLLSISGTITDDSGSAGREKEDLQAQLKISAQGAPPKPSEKLGVSAFAGLLALTVSDNFWFIAAISFVSNMATNLPGGMGQNFRAVGSDSFVFFTRIFLYFNPSQTSLMLSNIDSLAESWTGPAGTGTAVLPRTPTKDSVEGGQLDETITELAEAALVPVDGHMQWDMWNCTPWGVWNGTPAEVDKGMDVSAGMDADVDVDVDGGGAEAEDPSVLEAESMTAGDAYDVQDVGEGEVADTDESGAEDTYESDVGTHESGAVIAEKRPFLNWLPFGPTSTPTSTSAASSVSAFFASGPSGWRAAHSAPSSAPASGLAPASASTDAYTGLESEADESVATADAETDAETDTEKTVEIETPTEVATDGTGYRSATSTARLLPLRSVKEVYSNSFSSLYSAISNSLNRDSKGESPPLARHTVGVEGSGGAEAGNNGIMGSVGDAMYTGITEKTEHASPSHENTNAADTMGIAAASASAYALKSSEQMSAHQYATNATIKRLGSDVSSQWKPSATYVQTQAGAATNAALLRLQRPTPREVSVRSPFSSTEAAAATDATLRRLRRVDAPTLDEAPALGVDLKAKYLSSHAEELNSPKRLNKKLVRVGDKYIYVSIDK
ncbi:hypothetical protein B484DRAFT_456157 [Ochromonadaceae sp. CCMP2298]|nr:hypothetical protein B484DRAFT_456157 [Ochromonadaceae sp. CCMP2298]|mmetsp:Transcript_31531/g.69473  ORF Transcript_31531/g.69473 Transcript_31531/m.69473 type:complete len:644 (+) Transcript_31531:141-2072(+)